MANRSKRRSSPRVLLVRDRLHPVGCALRAERRAYGYVDHKGVGTSAVPVPLVRGKIDDVPFLYLGDGVALLLRAPLAGDDVEELALRVGVPVRPRPRLEEHAEEPGARGWDGHGLQPHVAREPLLRPAPGLHLVRRNDLHCASFQSAATQHASALRPRFQHFSLRPFGLYAVALREALPAEALSSAAEQRSALLC